MAQQETPLRAAALLVVFLSACASLSESECRSTNWYQLGKRCAAFGLKPDEAAYNLGWDDGNMEYRQRTGYGGGPD